jgi:DNA-binding CsgD family transcriptional regulator
VTINGADRAAGRLDALALAGLDLSATASSISQVVQQALPFQAACLAPADPATELITAALKFGELHSDADDQWAYWEYEAGERWNFQSTARLSGGVTTTHTETEGRPATSARHQEYFRDVFGFDDEMRVALRLDGHTWGFIALFRIGPNPFTPAEMSYMSDLAPRIARCFRSSMIAGATATLGSGTGPVVVVVDAQGTICQASLAAEARLAELELAPAGAGQLPVVLSTLAAAARAQHAGRNPQVPRMRLRSRSGGWVVAHASPMRSLDGSRTDVVVTVEEARPPEVIPLVVAAFGLTPREQAVVGLVLQGVSTTEIAASLHLSAYTIQDHLKSIFDKAGVRSRRDLIARVFYDQYAPRLAVEPSLTPSGWFTEP